MMRTLIAALMLAGAPVALAQSVHKANGTVIKLDRERGKVTIKHGPVASLNWPSMTMSFDVKDKALLDKAKAGQAVEFSFIQSGRSNVITEMKQD